MSRYLFDLIESFQDASNELILFKKIADVAGNMGFEYCCYGMRSPIPISRPAILVFDTYPRGWMAHYKTEGYMEIDPTVRAGLRSSQLIVWSNMVFADTPELWLDVHEFGMRGGIAKSSRTSGNITGLLTLARPGQEVTEDEALALEANVNDLSWVSHTLMSRYIVPKLVPEANVVLTAREREVLRWTAEGKTANEIGDILSISDRTVNFHVNNILTKLESINKTQAVVKAALIGLLD